MALFLRKYVLLFTCFSFTFTAFSQLDELDEMVESSDSIQISDNFIYKSTECPKLDSIIHYALSQTGKPYKFATFGPNTFDCSGLMYHTFNTFNINIGRSSRDQYKEGVKVPLNEIRPGDLVFFYRGKKSRKYIGHVGMVVSVDSNKNFTFVHSSSPKYGVRIDNSLKNAYANSFVGARRIIDCENSTNYSQINTFEFRNTESAPQTTSQNSKIVKDNTNKYYKVKRGDTLSAISRKYNIPVSKIQKLNNLKSDKIYEGQKLKISQ